MMKDIMVRKQYSTKMRLSYMTGKGSMFISPRDFVLISHVHFNNDGSIEIVAASVLNSGYPPIDEFVRGHIEMSGMRFIPVKDGSYIENIVIIDPKGDLPEMFKDSVSKLQSKKVKLLVTAYKNWLNDLK